ncbi:MAG: cysteine biosynthesis protein [Sphingobium sp.]|nr:MAG: cysteine biosynthesis protein [Sphingobium sp.]
MILSAMARALPQIFHPAARTVLLKSLGLTLLVFLLLGALCWAALHALFDRMGWRDGGGLAEAAAAALILAGSAWLLFRAVAIAILGFFSDAIVVAVEKESYPAAATGARPQSFTAGLRFALRSVGRTVTWNLLALPLYLILLVTGIGTLALFLVLNAYLLGRDLADMVEPRHPEMRPIAPVQRWLLGLVSALLFLLPVANLLAPILGAAMAVHMLHGRRETGQ